MKLSDAILRSIAVEFDRQDFGSDVPITALLFDKSGNLIGRGCNLRENRFDPTAHAEIVAIREAASNLATWRLDGTTLVSSLEPCLMCSSVIREARVARVFYAIRSASPAREWFDLLQDTRLPGAPVEVQILPMQIIEKESTRLHVFFANLRRRDSGSV